MGDLTPLELYIKDYKSIRDLWMTQWCCSGLGRYMVTLLNKTV